MPSLVQMVFLSMMAGFECTYSRKAELRYMCIYTETQKDWRTRRRVHGGGTQISLGRRNKRSVSALRECGDGNMSDQVVEEDGVGRSTERDY